MMQLYIGSGHKVIDTYVEVLKKLFSYVQTLITWRLRNVERDKNIHHVCPDDHHMVIEKYVELPRKLISYIQTIEIYY